MGIIWQGFAVRTTLQRITRLLPIEPMQALRGYALPRRLTRFQFEDFRNPTLARCWQPVIIGTNTHVMNDHK
jgi:hypothetical protein